MIQQFIEKHQTKVFKKYFCFFAFSKKQFDEQVNDNFDYISMGSGFYAPVEFVKQVIEGLDKAHAIAIKKCLQKHTLKQIIWYELGNYEVQISGDLTEVRAVLSDFNVSEELLIKTYNEFYDNCTKNNYF